MGWAGDQFDQAAAAGWRKGPFTPEEDKLLYDYVTLHGEGRWSSVARCAGVNRSGKSCRLRWVNYLRPGLKRGHITPQEEAIIMELHALWGNKWSTIARYLPGRTDNEIKNYWRTHFKKKENRQQKKFNPPHAQSHAAITASVEQHSTQWPGALEEQCVSQDATSWSDKSTTGGGLWDALWNNMGPLTSPEYCLGASQSHLDFHYKQSLRTDVS